MRPVLRHIRGCKNPKQKTKGTDDWIRTILDIFIPDSAISFSMGTGNLAGLILRNSCVYRNVRQICLMRTTMNSVKKIMPINIRFAGIKTKHQVINQLHKVAKLAKTTMGKNNLMRNI